MSDATVATTPERSLWRRIVKWGVRIVLVLVVLVVAVWSIWNYSVGRALRNEIDRIRAAGEPVTFRELTASLEKVDQANDAGPSYAAALELLRGRDKGKDAEIEKGLDKAAKDHVRPSSELLAEAEQLLKENRIALELIDTGRDLPGCNYDLGLDYGLSFVMPRLGAARGTAKMNSLRTRVLAFQGKGDEASRSLLSSLRMLRMFDRQPILIHHLVRAACLSLALDDIPIILEFSYPSPDVMLELENELLQAEKSMNLKRVWIAERVYSLEIMRNLISSPRKLDAALQRRPAIAESWPNSFAWSPFTRSMALDQIRTYSQWIEASVNDWPEALDAIKESDEEGWIGVFSKILRPSIKRAVVLTGRCIATARSARLAVMIERYRRSKGSLPTKLDEIEAASGEELPRDPFTGRGLIYLQTSDGYKVYSVGDNRKDDGGKLTGRKATDRGVHIRTEHQ